MQKIRTLIILFFLIYSIVSYTGSFGAELISRDYSLYYGDLHCHSKYSPIDLYTTIPPVWDSLIGHPRYIYAYARDTAQIQVLAISDHTHYTTPLLGGLYYLPEYWDSTKVAADECTTPGVFVALASFEWSSWYSGHINVFDSDSFKFTYQSDNTDSMYRWLSTRTNVIAQFNHPLATDFNAFRYRANIDSSMTLFEMQSVEQANRYYIALDSGWFVGMTSNQDNHVYKNYGGEKWCAGNRLTGIWADSLTKSSIYSALRAMRTFGTPDRNFSLKFTANNNWMGSKISNGSIQLRIFARDPDTTDLISRIDIITNGGVILDSLTNVNSNNATWQKDIITASYDNKYFYVRVIENDGQVAVSSAIWTRSELTIEQPFTANILPDRFTLENNYPNPFQTQTTIRYSLPVQEKISLQIYDVSGRIVRNLVDESKDRGVYTTKWNSDDDQGHKLANGIYFCRLQAGDNIAMKKTVMTR